jgi:hypothetical protein
LRTIELYSNGKFTSGNKDSLGREKPFFCKFRVNVATRATDLDTKDVNIQSEGFGVRSSDACAAAGLAKGLATVRLKDRRNSGGRPGDLTGALLQARLNKQPACLPLGAGGDVRNCCSSMERADFMFSELRIPRRVVFPTQFSSGASNVRSFQNPTGNQSTAARSAGR